MKPVYRAVVLAGMVALLGASAASPLRGKPVGLQYARPGEGNLTLVSATVSATPGQEMIASKSLALVSMGREICPPPLEDRGTLLPVPERWGSRPWPRRSPLAGIRRGESWSWRWKGACGPRAIRCRRSPPLPIPLRCRPSRRPSRLPRTRRRRRSSFGSRPNWPLPARRTSGPTGVFHSLARSVAPPLQPRGRRGPSGVAGGVGGRAGRALPPVGARAVWAAGDGHSGLALGADRGHLRAGHGHDPAGGGQRPPGLGPVLAQPGVGRRHGLDDCGQRPAVGLVLRGPGRGLADRGDGRHVGGVRPGRSAPGPVAAAASPGNAGRAAAGGLGPERGGGHRDGLLGLRRLGPDRPAIPGAAGPGGDGVDRRAVRAGASSARDGEPAPHPFRRALHRQPPDALPGDQSRQGPGRNVL